jgi:hypothetical protein
MEDHNSQELATTDQSGNQRSQILYGLYHLFTGIFKVIWLILSGIFNLIWGLCRKYSTQIKDLTNRYQEWIITMFQEHLGSWVKMNGALISIFFVFILSWFAVIGPFIIAPFTMSESADIDSIKEYKGYGNSTVHGLIDPLQRIADGVLMTNFLGVRFWNDNVYYQQQGQFVMYRQELFVLRDYIARNRSSDGQNENLVEAHNYISVDSSSFYPVNYDLQIKNSIRSLHQYLNDIKKENDSKAAKFIANSDNLAKGVRLLREQVLSIADPHMGISFANADNDYYKLRGNLIALYQFLKSLEPDFKSKMIEKGAYQESYLPLLKDLRLTIEMRPLFVMELLKHDLSTLRGKAQTIATKMAEFANKLADG